MKNKNLQGGLAPFLIIAIVAILAIGGGAYLVTKNKGAKVNTQVEGDVETQANANADANANANANLGINAKGSFRSLIGLGKNTQCSFTSVSEGVTSSGTVYITASGNMRGDYNTKTSSGVQTSSMILKDGYSYVWSGSQGAKMNVTNMGGSASAGAQAQQSVDLDSQVDYNCKDWSVDQSKFTLPSGVNFLDLEAMMKGSALPSGVNWDGTIKGGAQGY